MQMRASTQNRVLVTDIPPTLPTVAADANSIGEVIGNLIDVTQLNTATRVG